MQTVGLVSEVACVGRQERNGKQPILVSLALSSPKREDGLPNQVVSISVLSVARALEWLPAFVEPVDYLFVGDAQRDWRNKMRRGH